MLDANSPAGQILGNELNGPIPVLLVLKEMQMSLIGTLTDKHVLLVNEYSFRELQTLIHMECNRSAKRRVNTDGVEEVSLTVVGCNPLLNGVGLSVSYILFGCGLAVVTEVVVVAVDAVVLYLIVEVPNNSILCRISQVSDVRADRRHANTDCENEQRCGNQRAPSECLVRHIITFLSDMTAQISGSKLCGLLRSAR